MTMSTKIDLPDALQERVAPLADATGTTLQAWVVQALESEVELAEAREAFIKDAEASAAQVDAGGALYAAEDVASYLFARAAGKWTAARPKAR
jgi:predicted transcriptional regulator